MKAKLLYLILLSAIVFSAKAQVASDALNYSQTFNGGTARFVSMGGAFGALGGDFSSLSFNPAGLGVYRSSEFTITPSFKSRKVNSDYNSSNGEDTRNRLNLDNLGFVFSFKPGGDKESGLINLNVAFGYNRINDYNTYAFAKGNNSVNSIMDYFAGLANGYDSNNLSIPSDPNDTYNPYDALGTKAWEPIMAWNTYLINPTSVANEYEAALNLGDGVLQRNRISTSGSSGEYIMSLGMNISNKLFLGASFNVTSINYETSTTYSEDAFNTNDTIYNGDRFNYLDYRQTYETRGTGYNLKIGVIYKPIGGLRLGAAIHTPTYYNMEDTYSYSMFTNFKDGTSESYTPNGRYEYNLETPFKAIGSIAYIFKDLGLLSIDIEHVNYSTMRFRSDGGNADFSDSNDEIKSIYKSVNNIKVGGEVRIKDILLRGGYAFYPSPYKSGYLNKDANRSLISGGIGYRSGNFFVDAAYQYSIQKEKYVFYNLQNENYSITTNPISTKTTEGKFLVTLGCKF